MSWPPLAATHALVDPLAPALTPVCRPCPPLYACASHPQLLTHAATPGQWGAFKDWALALSGASWPRPGLSRWPSCCACVRCRVAVRGKPLLPPPPRRPAACRLRWPGLQPAPHGGAGAAGSSGVVVGGAAGHPALLPGPPAGRPAVNPPHGIPAPLVGRCRVAVPCSRRAARGLDCRWVDGQVLWCRAAPLFALQPWAHGDAAAPASPCRRRRCRSMFGPCLHAPAGAGCVGTRPCGLPLKVTAARGRPSCSSGRCATGSRHAHPCWAAAASVWAAARPQPDCGSTSMGEPRR